MFFRLLCGILVSSALAVPLVAQQQSSLPSLEIHRASGPITVDGDLSDSGWTTATRLDQWFETSPGDNIEPPVKTVAHLTYDSKYLYAGFDMSDPDPSRISAPFSDHDQISGSSIDYAGIILDTRNDGKTAILFLATPRGVQYDAQSDDTSGNEDSSPDFYWDSAAKINDHGWTLEIRIPFSTLRYEKREPMTWGVMLYRNYPRDRRHQILTTRIPRGTPCFICNEQKLVGLNDLPSGGNLIAAPYVSSRYSQIPFGDPGSALDHRTVTSDAGADVKWTPTATTAIDATVNPDFSQIESDVAAISANERFAIFYPEKRPFFLEGVDLLTSPINAVYTRTITSPTWGARSTGKSGPNAYTLLISEDRGGGLAIIPGPNGSDFAAQDFRTTDAIGRYKHELGKSYVGFLVADRENEGSSFNRVFGPDFQWRPNGANTITGQLLLSSSRTPNEPELAPEWDGRSLSGHGEHLSWNHSTTKIDWYTEVRRFGDEFRADSGFVPQVGVTKSYAEAGYTFRPNGFFSRVRTFLITNYTSDSNGALITREVSPGFGGDGRWNSFWRFRVSQAKERAGDVTLDRTQLLYDIEMSPSKKFADLGFDGWVGQAIDYGAARVGHGASVELYGTYRPTDHFQLGLISNARWLNAGGDRVFTAQVQRVKGTYTFTAKSFLRLVTQYVRTDFNTDSTHEGDLTSSILFAYKLNWQSVLYLGYGDSEVVDMNSANLLRNGRQLFFKVSYAFQH